MNLTKFEQIQSKIVSREQLQKLCSIWRIKNDGIVFTNGCFDLLHEGHISLLLNASQEGNRLVVGLNSDDSVKRLKGENRPVNHIASRALVLAALQFVDAVCVFEEDTPLDLIRTIQPDVLVKGGDYTIDNIVGADVVKENGGKVIVVPTLNGFSTTNIIEKLK